MSRRLLNLLTAGSLLLCAAVCALWVRSYAVRHSWMCTQPKADYRVESCAGQLAWSETYFGDVDRSFLQMPEYGAWRHSSTSPLPPLGERLKNIAPMPDDWFDHAGFVIGWSLTDRYINNGGPTRVVAVPYWAPFVLLGILPTLGAVGYTRQHRRLSRHRDGRCPACGYDLRATPDRCPECGAAAAPAGAA
jgi:hypothetical protein